MAVVKGLLLIVAAAFLSATLLLVGMALPSHFRFHGNLPMSHGSGSKEGWYTDSPAGVDRSLKDKEGWYSDSPAGMDKSLHAKTKDKEGWYTDSPSGIDKSLNYKAKHEGWYKDSPAGIDKSLNSKAKHEGGYKDSPAGIDKSLREKTKDEGWYKDSPAGIDKFLYTKSKDEGWYKDSPAGFDKSLHSKSKDEGWYKDSPAGVDQSLHAKHKEDKEGWYVDSPAGAEHSLHGKGKENREGWYVDSPAGVDKSIHANHKEHEEGWYVDSPAGVDKSLHGEHKEDKEGWYVDSPAGVSKHLHGEADSNHNAHQQEASSHHVHGMGGFEQPQELKRAVSKEAYEINLRTWIYGNVRTERLRDVSDRSSTLFAYEVHPRDDVVDRWHVPVEIQEEYAASNDARRVSLLNYYLMITGREPVSASELGFVPTADEPGLVEENEVGYGYAFTGQHQYHCVDFVADAVERGREGLSDFYLRHTVHCLGLLKANSRYLTRKEPLGMVRGTGRRAVDGEDPSTP